MTEKKKKYKDQAKMLDELRESEEKYRTLIETANDAIFLADTETGTIIDANYKAAELLGKPLNKIIGIHQSELHPKDEKEKYREMFKKDAKGGERFINIAEVMHSDGLRIPVQISANVLTLKGRRVLQGIFRDISEFKAIENSLKEDKNGLISGLSEKTAKLRKALKDLDDAKRLSDIGTLASTIAHELRNPLGVMQTALFNLRKKNRQPELEINLKSIEKKIAESNNIIKDLLSYSHVKVPQYKEVPILQLVKECIKNSKLIHPGTNVSIKLNHNCNNNSLLDADPLHMTQLIGNILNNSYAAFPDNDGEIKIDVGCNGVKNTLTIRIMDNGIGIDKKDLSKICEPFFTNRAKGIGLGLTVCRQVVGLHGGTLNIDSNKDIGTTVEVVLPLKKR